MAGGLERQLVRVAVELSQLGFNTIILSYDNEPSESFYEIPNKIKWIKCGNGLRPHTSAPFWLRIKQIYNLRKILSENSVTHLITFHHGIFPRSFLASLLLPIKKIVSERNSLSNYNYIKLSKFNLGYFSLFLADKITVQLHSYIAEYPKLLKNKIYLVPNLLRKIDSYTIPNIEGLTIAMMGRLSAQKNFTPLLDQCLENIDLSKSIRIKIAGEGEYRELFESKYHKLISMGILEMLGNIKNTQQFLKSSTIFCFSSLWEGYPNALVEAMGSGLPIVLSNRLSNLHDFVENKYNGRIVSDKDYLSSIISMLKNRKELRLMSKRSFLKYRILYKKSSIQNWIDLIN